MFWAFFFFLVVRWKERLFRKKKKAKATIAVRGHAHPAAHAENNNKKPLWAPFIIQVTRSYFWFHFISNSIFYYWLMQLLHEALPSASHLPGLLCCCLYSRQLLAFRGTARRSFCSMCVHFRGLTRLSWSPHDLLSGPLLQPLDSQTQ